MNTTNASSVPFVEVVIFLLSVALVVAVASWLIVRMHRRRSPPPPGLTVLATKPRIGGRSRQPCVASGEVSGGGISTGRAVKCRGCRCGRRWPGNGSGLQSIDQVDVGVIGRGEAAEFVVQRNSAAEGEPEALRPLECPFQVGVRPLPVQWVVSALVSSVSGCMWPSPCWGLWRARICGAVRVRLDEAWHQRPASVGDVDGTGGEQRCHFRRFRSQQHHLYRLGRPGRRTAMPTAVSPAIARAVTMLSAPSSKRRTTSSVSLVRG